MPIIGSLSGASARGYGGLFAAAAGGGTSSDRGIYGNLTSSASMEYITISTTGNGTTFGNSTVARGVSQGCGSATRILFAGGNDGARTNVIDYFTSATTGNATDFGDLTVARLALAGAGNSTRGIWAGGSQASSPSYLFSNTIDYVTIASTGNATDFGDLTTGRQQVAGAGNTTRSLFFDGENPSATSTIDYITIATTGNATSFGSLTSARSDTYSACASSTRAVHSAGYSNQTTMGYVTIATTGNATDFGTYSSRYANWALGNKTRGVFGCGTSGGSMVYITIATTGNATTFGTEINASARTAGASDCGGGVA